MKAKEIGLVVLLSVAVSLTTASFVSKPSLTGDAAEAKKETRLEQVKRTGTIRCGYVSWPPFLDKDANTGKMSGPFYDIVEEMGKQLNLKIEWAGEVATGQMLTDLNMNRYDMLCAPFAELPGRVREAEFTTPIFYSYVNLYVRKDDTRFDSNLDNVNHPDIKLATLDGEGSSLIAAELFPKATKVAMLQLTNGSDLFMNVASKKTDGTIQDPYAFSLYETNNPGVLKAATGKPILFLAAGFPLPANEPSFKAMLNSTIAYLHNSGFIDRTLKKYDEPVKFIRASKPYQE